MQINEEHLDSLLRAYASMAPDQTPSDQIKSLLASHEAMK